MSLMNTKRILWKNITGKPYLSSSEIFRKTEFSSYFHSLRINYVNRSRKCFGTGVPRISNDNHGYTLLIVLGNTSETKFPRIPHDHHGYTLLMVLGNGIASRICSSLQTHLTILSTPRPKPECWTEPYLRKSMYHS